MKLITWDICTNLRRGRNSTFVQFANVQNKVNIEFQFESDFFSAALCRACLPHRKTNCLNGIELEHHVFSGAISIATTKGGYGQIGLGAFLQMSTNPYDMDHISSS